MFRTYLSVGILERPLCIGLFWGLLTGDYATSLNISIFFELFWLDLLPAGTFIPPHLTAATFAGLSLATYLGLSRPAEVMVAVFASIPMAWLGVRLDSYLREWQNKNYNRLLQWARHPDSAGFSPGGLVARSAGVTFFWSWLFFFVLIFLLVSGVRWFLGLVSGHLDWLGMITWTHLWLAASIGGLMALRLKKAYAIFTLGFVGVIFFAWLRWL